MKIAILIKYSSYTEADIKSFYTDPLVTQGIDPDNITVGTLAYPEGNKKPSAKFLAQELPSLIHELQNAGIALIYCADAAYFKALTKVSKTAPHLGYELKCHIDENISVVLGINYKSLILNPRAVEDLDRSLVTVSQLYKGEALSLASHPVTDKTYPVTPDEIIRALRELQREPQLTCDIETASLHLRDAGLATIAFSKDKTSGVAIAVDRGEYPEQTKTILKKFFLSYRGKLIFHACTFDIKNLIFMLWMEDPLDNEGLLQGLECLYQDTEDTRMLSYLCLNSTVKPSYSLKDLAHEYLGNWAQEDIKDTTKIPLDKLLSYNIDDTAATMFVYEKYKALIAIEEQEEIYASLIMPAQKLITQIELTGMPMYRERILEAENQLQELVDADQEILDKSSIVHRVETLLTERAWEKDYTSRRDKAKNPDKILPKDKATFPRSVFNPNSPKQLTTLLYEDLGFEVNDYTPTGAPATGIKILTKLINFTEDPEVIQVLETLISLSQADKILTAFIPAFNDGFVKADGMSYLHGSFNQGVVPSGRLSSSQPNLQQIPSGSKYGKLIKACFVAPKGWVMCGADFNALEDRISALLTRDPNKLKIFIQHIDSHSFSTFVYWPEKCEGITEENINDIVERYAKLRGKSKTVTFALIYGGTAFTLVKNSGFSYEEANRIIKNYNKIYAKTIQFYKDKKQEACTKGFVELAFGLKLRTPILKQSVLGSKATLYEAEAEGRTLGNAVTQSYGLLNTRAAVAFMEEVRNSPYRNDIKPIALIHDAIYLICRDNVKVVKWVNDNLIKHMSWQDLPELKHPDINLETSLEAFHPSWANAIELPNNISEQEITSIAQSNIQ